MIMLIQKKVLRSSTVLYMHLTGSPPPVASEISKKEKGDHVKKANMT